VEVVVDVVLVRPCLVVVAVAVVVLVDLLDRPQVLVRPVRATMVVPSRVLMSVHIAVQAVAVSGRRAPTATVQPVLADLGTRFRVRFTRVVVEAGRWVRTS